VDIDGGCITSNATFALHYLRTQHVKCFGRKRRLYTFQFFIGVFFMIENKLLQNDDEQMPLLH